MGGNKKPRHRKSQQHNNARPLPKAYNGNARFLELGAENILHREFVNVDQITNIRFEEQIEQRPFPNPNLPPVIDDDGNESPQMEVQSVVVGFNIIVCFPNNNNSISFNNMEQAISLYNSLVDQVVGLGVPCTRLPPLEAPKIPSGIVGADGQPVDAADLHPGLAGGEGDGINEEAFELTDEEIEMLENPEIDEDAIAEAFGDVGEEEPSQPN